MLTDGADPALVVAGGEAVAQPVPAVEVRNAAGAGDALAGAYLAARLRGDARRAASPGASPRRR